MERRTKENLMMAVGTVLLGVLNGAAGARVIYSLLNERFKKYEKHSARRMLSERSFRAALSKLKKQGIVESGGWGLWRLTKKGSDLARDAEEKRISYERVRALSRTEKNTIVIFDVPESRRRLRDYLRIELVSLGYEQLQKSVWIGSGPLPEAFMGFVKEKKLEDTMHIFTIERKGTISF